ncbi:MAG TPA: YtxH domain-containing protein [Chloroflexi bacterium]|nr:YtxH domain-containing protein [Chloroflexota bacterium]
MVGAVVAILFAPVPGTELQERVRSRAQALIEEGKKAAAARQEELAAQLESFKRGAPTATVPEEPAPQVQG